MPGQGRNCGLSVLGQKWSFHLPAKSGTIQYE
nr:MAG TPA: hypothetical protein [Caudoviricetes sp.]